MEQMVDNGDMQIELLSQDSIEVLLGIVEDVDDLDDDEFTVIESLVRSLPPDSIYDMHWFENMRSAQQASSD